MMKKNILIALLMCFCSGTVSAQTFNSEEEIDAYYDAQLQELEEQEQQNKEEIEAQLQKDLDQISKQTDQEIWDMYKEVYGEYFESVKPFLPESNPDPAYHANNLLTLTENEARKAIENIRSINPALANQVESIYNKSVTTTSTQKPSAVSMFEYIDSLPLHEASQAYRDLKTGDPALYKEVEYLINLKYPNGKPGSAQHDEYLAQQAEEIVSTVPDVTSNPPTYNQEPVANVSKTEHVDETATNTVSETEENFENITAAQTESEPVTESTEPKKPNILVRIFNFFKSWF